MNNELLAILNNMEKERGIDRDVLLRAVEYALQTSARKSPDLVGDVRVAIDRKTLDIRVLSSVVVVEDRVAGSSEITVSAARRTHPECKVGDTIEIEVTPRNFGRIAAQAAKQAIMQKIRMAERELVFEQFKDQKGSIVSGAVRQYAKGDLIIDLGRAEAILPSRERVPTEDYQVGDRIRAYVLSVQNSISGASITLSRSHPDFVRALFGIEVAEISDGLVEIKSIAREAGHRAKIAVASTDPRIDPVGACVGMRGSRVKNIVRELSGERVDIVRWSEDIREYATNALSPAKLASITIDEVEPNTLHIECDADQLSLAIGKRGQNVRLTAKLIGWKVDIQKRETEMSFEEKVARAVDRLAAIDGISHDHAQLLVSYGFLSVEGILAITPEDLAETTGLELDVARNIVRAAEDAP